MCALAWVCISMNIPLIFWSLYVNMHHVLSVCHIHIIYATRISSLYMPHFLRRWYWLIALWWGIITTMLINLLIRPFPGKWIVNPSLSMIHSMCPTPFRNHCIHILDLYPYFLNYCRKVGVPSRSFLVKVLHSWAISSYSSGFW